MTRHCVRCDRARSRIVLRQVVLDSHVETAVAGRRRQLVALAGSDGIDPQFRPNDVQPQSCQCDGRGYVCDPRKTEGHIPGGPREHEGQTILGRDLRDRPDIRQCRGSRCRPDRDIFQIPCLQHRPGDIEPSNGSRAYQHSAGTRSSQPGLRGGVRQRSRAQHHQVLAGLEHAGQHCALDPIRGEMTGDDVPDGAAADDPDAQRGHLSGGRSLRSRRPRRTEFLIPGPSCGPAWEQRIARRSGRLPHPAARDR